MNIFYLHEDPDVSAKMHCDKHVVKMIIEYAQLMSDHHGQRLRKERLVLRNIYFIGGKSNERLTRD